MFPSAELTWACEVEWSHGDRIVGLLEAKGISLATLEQVDDNKKQKNLLVFTRQNVVLHAILPTECFKHISRIFHLPYTCADLSWMHKNRELQELIAGDAVFKVQASPKHLERGVAEVLIDDTDEDGLPRPHKVAPDHIHPSRCTHIVQVVYSPHEALFRWGVVSKDAAEGQCMTSVSLEGAVGAGRAVLIAGPGGAPASKAFFKMQEVFEFYFPKW